MALNIFVAGLVYILFAGVEISSVKGLHCPTCYRIGPFGSRECELMPCNSAADAGVAVTALLHLISETLEEMGYRTGKKISVNLTDYVAAESLESLRVQDDAPPVCVKIIGSVGPDGKLHYIEASCRSEKSMEVKLFGHAEARDTPCEIKFAPHNNMSHIVGGPMTVDLFCMCTRDGHQEDCHVSQNELNGLALSILRTMDPSNKAKTKETQVNSPQQSGAPSSAGVVILVLSMVVGRCTRTVLEPANARYLGIH